MQEIYVSTDTETDGPIPGDHSMLSLGSAAFLADKTLVSSFEVNLEVLPSATSHPETMKWWSTQPEAWIACRQKLVAPSEAMAEYHQWVLRLPGKPIFVAYPVAFDFMFVQWYLVHFTGRSPFGHAGIDIKSFATALLNQPYASVAKERLPRRWLDAFPHKHTPLADAIEQGAIFCNLLSEAQARGGVPID